jgi:Tol biopolymer transport system component
MNDPQSRLAEALTDRYRIEREVGRGGMATVYLAHDIRHNRKVALKVLASELAALIGADRFLKEIEVTANLQHPHILPLFDSGAAQAPDGSKFLYYVMPFVEGDTLRDRLNREKQLGVEEAVGLTRSVAGALDYAHRRGVIHRDIKPENILLHDGQALVADFGIALAVREAGGTRLTGTGLSVGTPSYMSPEQAMGDRELDARSDVYSLGAMLYEMLAGDPPFTGSTAQAIVARILTESAPLVTRARSAVPPNVAAAIHKALERLPADRFASAGDFSAALGNPAFSLPTLGSVTSGAGRQSLWNPLSVAASCVALAALIGAAWLGTRPQPEIPVRRLTLTLPKAEALAPGTLNRLALAPDGSAFVYSGVTAPGGGFELLYRPFNRLTATRLPGTGTGSSPSFSPDGSRIAFMSNNPFALKVAAINGAPAITLTSESVVGGGVAWSADDWIYFDGGGSIDRIRPDGSGREAVVRLDSTASEVGFAWPEPLPNGKGLIYRVRRASEGVQNYRLNVLDLRTRAVKTLVQGVMAKYVPTGHLIYVTAAGVLLAAPFDQDRRDVTGPPVPLLEGLGIAGFGAVDLALARSGDLMYFTSGERGGERLSWVRRDGSAEVLDPDWTITPETILNWKISPDGKRLALALGTGMGGVGSDAVGRSVAADIWVKELDRGPLSKLTFDGINFAPAWSTDEQWIYYVGASLTDPTPRPQAYRIRADGSGSREPLLTESRGLSYITVSPQGGWVVVVTNPSLEGNGDILAFRPGVDTAMVLLVASPSSFESNPAVSPDGRWLAYSSNESGQFEVYVRPFPDVDRGKWQVSLGGGGLPRWGPDGTVLFYNALGADAGHTMVRIQTAPTFSVGRRERLHLYGANFFYDLAPDGQRSLWLWAGAGADSSVARLVLVQNFLSELRKQR